jgi:hypothetical protein
MLNQEVQEILIQVPSGFSIGAYDVMNNFQRREYSTYCLVDCVFLVIDKSELLHIFK